MHLPFLFSSTSLQTQLCEGIPPNSTYGFFATDCDLSYEWKWRSWAYGSIWKTSSA
uniref:Uncharacterized protein MANES_15G059300 n=1 Tax=Rhizophora mucronata TaxID=61149 RepID=A0A2P2K2Q9_RHIMU